MGCFSSNLDSVKNNESMRVRNLNNPRRKIFKESEREWYWKIFCEHSRARSFNVNLLVKLLAFYTVTVGGLGGYALSNPESKLFGASLIFMFGISLFTSPVLYSIRSELSDLNDEMRELESLILSKRWDLSSKSKLYVSSGVWQFVCLICAAASGSIAVTILLYATGVVTLGER